MFYKIMDDKKAIEILFDILKKYTLDDEEKKAVHSAIGTLSLTSLAKSRLVRMKDRKDKKSEMSLLDTSFRGRRKVRKIKNLIIKNLPPDSDD
jgi:hypothetical protein